MLTMHSREMQWGLPTFPPTATSRKLDKGGVRDEITNAEWQPEVQTTLTESSILEVPPFIPSCLPTKMTSGGSSLGETSKCENERDLVEQETVTSISLDREQSWLEMGGER